MFIDNLNEKLSDMTICCQDETKKKYDKKKDCRKKSKGKTTPKHIDTCQ